MNDFSKKRALIIDDSPAMCSSLRMTLNNFGITRCETSNSANEAIFRIRQREFDIIVCDYCLGEGSDGQQILEQLRRSAMIAQSVVFLMVTAERDYEKVVSCAEFAPDDYLLKPFTAETICVRLERIFEKKLQFAQLYQLIADGKAEQALAECDRMLALKNKFAMDLIRMKGELLIALNRPDAAKKLYEEIIAARAIPWARLGLAKSLNLAGEPEAAIETLELVIGETPHYLEAYDTLARTHENQGNLQLAQEILEKAVAVSPQSLSRQSAMGEIAYRNGDLAKAAKAFGTVVDKGKYSYFRNHKDFISLSRVLMEEGKHDTALCTIADARRNFDSTPELDLASSVMESLIHHAGRETVQSGQALSRALEIKAQHGLSLADSIAVDLAKVCFLNGKEEEARELVKEMISNFYEDEKIQSAVRGMLDDIGRSGESQALIDNSINEVIKLNNEGVMRAKNGDLAGSVDLLVTASKRMPQNVQVALNAAQALIVESDRNGWNGENMRLAAQLLANHAEQHGNLEKFQKISRLHKDIRLKYGIAGNETK
ncbi:MAG TPA: tetratricopeptide repeat protein [Burkholderiales bacterium]|nr:tetratricopeptide repeat protein [Burkholderiales bacterium]